MFIRGFVIDYVSANAAFSAVGFSFEKVSDLSAVFVRENGDELALEQYSQSKKFQADKGQP